MNKRIQQRTRELINLADRACLNRRKDYSYRLKSFLDKLEKLDAMNSKLFKGDEKAQLLNEIWHMYHNTLKHMSLFYSASKWIEDTEERLERSTLNKQVFIDGIESGEILDTLHTNLALEHMGGDGFYKVLKAKTSQSSLDWQDESWSRDTDVESIDNMSVSSLESMLNSYAVTFDNIENEIDRDLSRNAYLDRLDAFTWQ